jgi:hypothetical protein
VEYIVQQLPTPLKISRELQGLGLFKTGEQLCVAQPQSQVKVIVVRGCGIVCMSPTARVGHKHFA